MQTAGSGTMEAVPVVGGETARGVLSVDQLQLLLNELAADGFTVVGPTVRDSTIVYGEISSVADFPAGEIDEQSPGSYRLEKSKGAALFGAAVGPQSIKQFVFPPTMRMWSARRREATFDFESDVSVPPRLALVGVRPCELAALTIQDRVFMGGPYVDPVYASRRSGLFLVAVNCGRASGTCFCASMGTGPAAQTGFDLALTEIIDGVGHRFLVEAGSPAGATILARVPHGNADEAIVARAAEIVRDAAAHMGRSLDTTGLRDALYEAPEHPRWEQVAKRCLTCANCTMVCPTCFCSTVEDTTSLSGDRAERWRRWDSCFTLAFSYVVGGSVRRTAMSRYRQWLMHKLSAWNDQFGSMGCVGCGRCITWCPAGIDITEEAAAIRGTVPGSPGNRQRED